MFDVLSTLPSSPQALWPPNSLLLLGLCTHCQSTCLDPRWASPYSALHGTYYLTASGLTELPKPMVCDLLCPLLDPFRSFSLIFEVKSGQNFMYQPFPHLTAMVSSVSTSFPLSLTKISVGVALSMLWIFSLGPFFSV